MERLLSADRQSIIDFERTFPARLSQSQRKDWGIIFYAQGNPLSHDSNHALITRKPGDWAATLMEITEIGRAHV